MSRTHSIKFPNSLSEFEAIFDKLQRALSVQVLNSAGLAIGSSNKPKVKIVNTIYALIEGVIRSKTTAEIVLSMDSAGTVTATMGTEASTLAGVTMPALPDGSAMIGFVIVNPTGTGNFVGGTTDLDDATVVPNAVYVNTPFPILPSMQTL